MGGLARGVWGKSQERKLRGELVIPLPLEAALVLPGWFRATENRWVFLFEVSRSQAALLLLMSCRDYRRRISLLPLALRGLGVTAQLLPPLRIRF